MFGDEPPKNRRMTAWEREQEIQEAVLWGRTPRWFILDKHFYPDCPPVPKYSVNFDLNAPQ